MSSNDSPTSQLYVPLFSYFASPQRRAAGGRLSSCSLTHSHSHKNQIVKSRRLGVPESASENLGKQCHQLGGHVSMIAHGHVFGAHRAAVGLHDDDLHVWYSLSPPQKRRGDNVAKRQTSRHARVGLDLAALLVWNSHLGHATGRAPIDAIEARTTQKMPAWETLLRFARNIVEANTTLGRCRPTPPSGGFRDSSARRRRSWHLALLSLTG